MKRTTICIIILLAPYFGFSQIFSGLLTDDQNMIRKATDSVLYIIRQDYVLRDTTNKIPSEYGRGGKEYFGRIYALAIISDNKLWCDAKIRAPWLEDVNFKPYQHIDSVRPYLSKTAIRQINQRKFQESDIQLFGLQSKYDSLINKIGICYYSQKKLLKGIKYLNETKDSTGWIILAYTSEDFSHNDSCNINLSIFKAQPHFKPNEADAVVKAPSITQNIIGGIYMNIAFSIGEIEVFFSGILNKRSLNWYVSTLLKLPVSFNNEDNRLTPINRNQIQQNEKLKKKTKKKKDTNN